MQLRCEDMKATLRKYVTVFTNTSYVPVGGRYTVQEAVVGGRRAAKAIRCIQRRRDASIHSTHLSHPQHASRARIFPHNNHSLIESFLNTATKWEPTNMIVGYQTQPQQRSRAHRINTELKIISKVFWFSLCIQSSDSRLENYIQTSLITQSYTL